ncbi:hypothetical protein [Nocardia gipuzkoensis]|uniref:hypothetical protein n=1 Tax=Nocardia gipuzkoensis TaxID=2749991 RepID=UPI00237DEFBE|nr:hypothetical protein [Nocardia gipuzkoensis]MDE1672649.1 hypothetical protein [Nocardia gipuzkoensis]
MAGRGFAHLAPDTTPSAAAPEATATPPSRTPTRSRWPRGWIAGAAIAAVAAAAVTAALAGGGGDAATGGGDQQRFTVRAAHGPTRVIDNVPAGYSRDREGAATAAVNVVQALAQAGQGRIDMSKVVAGLVAADPGPQLRASIDISRDRATEQDVLNVLPAAVTVSELTDTSAQVSVWTMGVSRASIAPGDPVSVTTLWSTSTVSLVWQDEDWKVREKTGRVGPTPDEVVAPNSGSPLTKPLTGGYYSFYVN